MVPLADMHYSGQPRTRALGVKGYTHAAEKSDVRARYTLGQMAMKEEVAVEDGVQWLQLAAMQHGSNVDGSAALNLLKMCQESAIIPVLTTGTEVTVVMFGSELSARSRHSYDGRAGKVAPLNQERKTSAERTPGQVAVLLDGEQEPVAFKLMNLRIDKLPPTSITNLRILQIIAISFVAMYCVSFVALSFTYSATTTAVEDELSTLSHEELVDRLVSKLGEMYDESPDDDDVGYSSGRCDDSWGDEL